ncbi:hypothetical protein YC2023_108575 [Brassica napus]
MTSVAVRQHTQDVRGFPPAHTRCLWLSVCVRGYPPTHTGRLWLSISTQRTSVCVHQHTQDVHVCLSAHTRRPCVFVCVRQHTQDVRGCPSVHISARCTHRTSVGVRQQTQDVHGCLWLSVSTHMTSVAVCVCPSADTGRLWLSISTHIRTLVLGLNTLALPMDCSGDFGPRGLSVQYTQDVRGCPTHISTLVLGLSTLTLPMDCSGDFGLRGLSVQYTQDVRGCPPAHTGRLWLSVCVRVFPSAHTGRLWLPISTHISTLVFGLSTLALPVDCLGDFGPRGLSVQYKQDVRGCPPTHTGRPWLSISTHISTLVLGLSRLTLLVDCSGDFALRGLSVQYTQDVRGCPPAHTGRPWLSVCIRVFPSAHTGRLWLSISTHISTLVFGLSTLALPVDCWGDFGPRGLYVQYTKDVCGCPPAHTGPPWLSVAVRQHTHDVRGCPCLSVCVFQHKEDVRLRGLSVQYTQDVCGCPPAHTGRMWLSVCVRVFLSAHIGRLWLGLSVKYTHDVRGCPPAHTGRLWLSASTHRMFVAVRVCPSTHTGPHTGRPLLSISTHISTQVLGLSSLALPVDCLGDFGPHGLSVQYTQDVRGCPPADTGCSWLSVAVRQHTHDVCGCPCVSVSRHRTSVAVHQYTYQNAVHTGRPWVSVSTHMTSVAVRVCPLTHRGRPWLSISTHISTLVLGLSTLTLPMDCSGDFGLRGLSVQYTQDVRGCPPAHTGCLWLSVCVRVFPSAHTGRLWLPISTHISTLVFGLSMLALPVDCLGDFGPRGLSVQYKQDVRGCPPTHTGRPWLSVSTPRMFVCVRQHTGRPCVSVCVHQHTQDIRGCPSVHISARCTHRMSVGVRQQIQDVRRSWPSISRHISMLVLGLSTLALPVDCLGDFAHVGCLFNAHRTSVGVRQHTQDVCGCSCVFVCVRLCPSAHTGCPWLSISTHISTLVLGLSTLVLGLSTLALPVECLGDFGPRGLSVQYTQDIRGCPSADTGCSCVLVSTHRMSVAVRVCPCLSVSTQDIRGCPSVHISARCTHMTSVGVRQHTQYVRGCSWLSVSTHRTYVAVRVGLCVSVCVRQHTQDVRGCPSVHISARCTHRTSVAVHQHTQDIHGCPTHISMLVLGLSTLALPMDCSGDFGPRGLCFQYTQDIRGCPSAYTGRPCVSVSTHRSSVAVRVCLSAHTGRMWLSISTHSSTLVLGLSTLTLPVDCSGDFGPCGLSVQYTQDVCGCPSAHTGRSCVSVSTHRTSVAVRVCPCVSVSTHRTSVAVHQYTYQHYTQDVRGCPPAHTGRSWLSVSTHRTSVAVRVCPCVFVRTHRPFLAIHQYTYQHAVLWTQHTGPSRGLFGTSVAVRVCVRVCPSAHISTLVLGMSTMGHLVDCLGDFGPRGLSIQNTQDVRGCPPAHTGRPWVSVSTHKTSMAVRVCQCVSVCLRQHTQDVCGCSSYTQAVCGCPSAHTRHPWLSVCVSVCLCVSVSTHRTSVAVHQYTYQHAGPWTQHAALPVDCSGDFGPRGLSVQYTQDIRWCPSAHTGRPTHISTLVLGLSTLTLPVDCSGDFGPCGLSVQCTQDVRGCRQLTQDVRGCPSAHTGRLCVSISTHRTSVCVHQHTQDVRGCPSVHISARWSLDSTLALPVDCSGDFGPRGLSVQYKQNVRGTHRTSVGVHQHTHDVRVCPTAHKGHLTHISTLVLGISTLGHPVDCLGDFGPHGLSVQYTQDVPGFSPAHTGRPWMSVSTHKTSVCVRQHTQVVRGYPCVSVSTHKTSVAVHPYTYQHVGPWTQHADPSHGLFGTHRTSVAVRVCPCVSVSTHRTFLAVHQYTYQHAVLWTQHTGPSCGLFGTHKTSMAVRVCQCMFVCLCQHTQDVCGCSCVFVCVRLCPSAHTGCPWLSISTHISTLFLGLSTLVLGLSTLALPVECLGDFGPRGLSVQYTQDIRGCPSADTGCSCVLVSTHRMSVAVRVCPCLSVSTQDIRGCQSVHISARCTHMTSVGVRQHTQYVRGCSWLSVSTHRTYVAVRVGDFGPCGLSVQYTQNVCGCPSAHTRRPCVFVCVRQHTHDVRGCPSVHISARCTHRTSVGVRQQTQDVHGCLWLSVSTHMTSVAVRVCPSADTGRLWLSISTHIRTLVLGLNTLALPMDCSGDFGPRGLSVQYTQDVCGCSCVFVCVRLCPSAHTGCPWLSISTHISTLFLGLSTLVLGLSTLALPVECLGDFGPRGLSVQYTQDIRGCPSADTGCSCVLVSTHRMSVAVRVCPCLSVSTQDIRGCQSVHISARCTHMTSVGVRQHTQYVRGCSWLSVSTHRTYVAVRVGDFGPCGLSVQYTQNVCGCPSAHTRRPCVFVCVRQHTHDVRGCPSVHISARCLALPVDCLGDFGPHGLSVQYTQDVRGCPPADTGCPWLSVAVRQHTHDVCGCPCVSVSRHRTFVAVHQYTYQNAVHTGRPWVSVSTHMTSVAVRVCHSTHRGRLWLSISTHISTLVLGLSTLTLPMDCSGDFGLRGLSVQYTQDVRGCPPAHTGRLWLSVCVRVFPSAHTGRLWLPISTHISTLVFGLSTLAFPVDCLGDFGPCGLSVQYKQDVRGCPPTHTGRPWLSISTHISTLVLGLSRLTLLVDCSGDFGLRGLSVQYTQDVRGCPPAHTGRPWLSVCIRVFPSAHTGRLWLSISTHISTLVFGLSTLALPVDCWGDFGPRGLYVQYTKDVCGCPPAHTGPPWLSVAVRQHTHDVRGCPCLSVCVFQHKEDVRGCLSIHISALHTGRLWVSASTHRTYVAVRVCPCVSVSTHRTSVAVHHTHKTSVGVRQHTQDVRGYPWLSVSTHRTSVAVRVCLCVSVSTHMMSVCVRQHTQDVRGCPCVSICVRQHTQDVRGCPLVHISARCGLSVKYTHDVRGCPPAHTGRLWLSASTHRMFVAVRVCPSTHTGPHTGRPLLSISTHISTQVLGLSSLALPVDCLGDFGPHGLSVQYTQDVRGCPPADTGCPWLSVAVRQHTHDVCGCPCVSVSRHRTSVAVHQYTYQNAVHTGRPWVSVSTHMTSVAVRVCPLTHRGRPWLSISTHISTLVLGLSTLTLPMDCSGDFGLRGLSVQYTQDVRGCPPAHTGCLWLSVCVRVFPSAHTGRLWLPISTHISTLVFGLSMLALPVDCLGDFGPRGLSVQYKQDVRGCPPTHTGRPWLSVSTPRTFVCVRQHTGRPCVSVCVHQHTQDIRGCPSVHISARCTHRMSVGVRQQIQDVRRSWPSISRHISMLVLGLSTLALPVDCLGDFAHVGCLFNAHRTSVGVRQHTQDVCGCSCVFVCVRLCPSAHTGCPWLSISTHISTLVLGLSTLVLGLSTLALPVECLGDFGPRGLSVQYTQDIRGCPSADTGCSCVLVSTHRMSVAVRVCPCLSVSTQDIRGCPSVHISARCTHMTSVGVRQHTQYVRGCSWLSVSTHSTYVAVRVGLCVSVCVRQHTQDVRGCPSVHISARCTHRTSVAVHQHTQDIHGCPTHISMLVLGLSTLALPMDCSGDFGPRGLCFQYTQDIRGCPSAHTGRPCVSVSTHRSSVAVRVSLSAHTGRMWLSISTHSSTLVLGLSTLTLPVDCSGDFGPCGLSVQYTQDVCGCPSAHTGRSCVSVSTHRTSVAVRVCPCVSVSTHRTSVAVHQYTYQHYTQDVRGCPPAHTGRSWLSVSTHRTSVAVRVCPCVFVRTHRPFLAIHQYTYQHAVLWNQHTGPSRGLFGTSVAVRVCVRVCPSAHISTLVLGMSTMGHLVDCLGDFGPRGLSIQYTQDVRGCPPAHTGRLWVSVSTHKTSMAVRVCQCVSVCLRQHTQDVCGCSSYTQAVCGCPSAHTRHPWLSVCVSVCLCVSVSTHRTSVAVHQYTYQHAGPWTQHAALPVDCSGDFGPRGLSVQYTQDIRCTHMTSVAVHQYTYQHVGPWTQHADPSRGLFGTSVGVRQHTQDVCVCPSAHTGRPCVSISTHRTSVAVHQYTYQHAGP